jgi:hypothetical protein
VGYKLLLLFVMLSFTIKAQTQTGVFLTFEEVEGIKAGFFNLTSKIEELEKRSEY